MTVTEKVREREEIVWGNHLEIKEGDDAEEEEGNGEVYKPKNLPLGWDGKPIPFWLYKLHGLNHYYTCEICGNEVYRGARDYEKHFGEVRHSRGMKVLGINMTKAYHGVDKIEDARKLADKIENEGSDNRGSGEQFEDNDGNVMSKEDYEGLARQGLL